MVILLISLKCNVIFVDPKNKKGIIRDSNGQTILYWIVKNMPELVSHSSCCKAMLLELVNLNI